MPNKPLDSDQWHQAIVGGTPIEHIVDDINNSRSFWYQAVLDATSPGDSLLELGSGTGVFSGILAKNRRTTTLLDYNEQSVDYAREVFARANLPGEFVKADVRNPFPFADNTFDCVWSSGLLEHFTDDEVAFIMQESARVSRKTVISLVPNAASLFYRVGKWYQESHGLWPWGKEDAKYTLKNVFRRCHLTNIVEFSIDAQTAFGFLNPIRSKTLRYPLLACARLLPAPAWASLRQGYLLVTVGKKAGAAPEPGTCREK